MLDFDLAELYEVETRVLNQSIKRNIERFPSRFMFQLNEFEWNNIRMKVVENNSQMNSSQIVMSSGKHRGHKYLPYAFTEHGVTMLATILKSKKAILINIAIIDAFIILKEYTLNYDELSRKLKELETLVDKQFNDIFEAINYLLKKDNQTKKQQERNRIGFKNDEK